MSFQEDVHEIILQVLNDCGGNKAEAARRLGTNPVTFWLWVQKDRQPIKEAISRAIDCSGARLVFSPLSSGEIPHAPKQIGSENLEEYKIKVAELTDALKQSEAARQSLAGEVKALERQLARLIPAPSAHTQTDGELTVVKPLALDENEQPSSGLKTANE